MGNPKKKRPSHGTPPVEYVAGGGLLSRRTLLTGAATLAGGTVVGLGPVTAAQQASPLVVPPWMKVPGESLREYGTPSPHASAVKRSILRLHSDIAPGTGVSFTPLHDLEGTITPNGLHFERHHNGVPQIDPALHKLLIHGLVKRQLIFSLDDLLRYPMTTRTCFIECSGNSFFNAFAKPEQKAPGDIHGLISCSEWTGISLSVLLEEAGVKPGGTWLLVEGADAAGMSRSVPVEKAVTDAIVAFYQNGEPVRPEQGYPMRLVLPGWEGNMSVKWLRRIKVTRIPVHTKDETSKYTDMEPGGKARQFTFEMGAKSVITRPAVGNTVTKPGWYEISGLAWSGAGRIVKVEVSADGGRSWAEAQIQSPALPQALTRFRMAWDWSGGPAILQSRATDDHGNGQMTREAWAKQYAPHQAYHYNAIQSWQIDSSGKAKNVYI